MTNGHSAHSAYAIEPGDAAGSSLVKVWDPFVRIFHWLLLITFATAWYTGGIWDQPHLISGYFVLALILGRIFWGFLGPRHALFSDFAYPPRIIFRYLGDMAHLRSPRYLGHNPAGGAMVMALLAMLFVLSISGIMMTTDAFWGVEWVNNLHATASNIALVLVAFHVGGVVFASVEHGENLVRAMITGFKRRS
jgi:cytochrome b